MCVSAVASHFVLTSAIMIPQNLPYGRVSLIDPKLWHCGEN
jgi:hypothetical protein